MAKRVHPTPIDADNTSGSVPAVRTDWRFGDADSMSARDIDDPTSDAGYTTAGASPKSQNIGQFLELVGESIYDQLGGSALIATPADPTLAALAPKFPPTSATAKLHPERGRTWGSRLPPPPPAL